MGLNFKTTTHGKIGEIIYPANNQTNGFWKEARWDLITRVDRNGRIMDIYYIWDFSTVKAIELIQKLYDLNVKGEGVKGK